MNRLFRRICIYNFLFLFFGLGLSAKHEQKIEADEETKEIRGLIHLAKEYALAKNKHARDSVSNLAIELAELKGNDALLIHAYEAYFAITDFSPANNRFLSTEEANEHAKHILTIAENNDNNQWKVLGYTAEARTHLLSQDYDKALQKIEKANYYVNLLSSDSLKIQNYIVWGKCLEADNNKLDAFRNYLNGFYLAQKKKNNKQLAYCYNALAHFYLLIENYNSARLYKLKEIGLKKNADSLTLMYDYSDLARIQYYNDEHTKADKLTHKIVDYAKRNDHQDLINQAFLRHRSYLVENGKLDELTSLYTKEYPEELTKLSTEDTATYYRTMALISEAQGNIGQAKSYYDLVEKRYTDKPPNKILLSNVYKRYGQFLSRTGNKSMAIAKIKKSYDIAEEVNYIPYLVETSQLLDSLYKKKGDLKNAYFFSKKNKAYSDKQSEIVKQDEILQMEVNNESRQRKLKNDQEQAETERRHNLQYMGIIILMISVFIALLMLSSFKVPTWVIKSLGFFAFIFLFEFIILLLDHKIMEVTHHEPWKMLALKVILISFLLPFHHWVEHKVVHYLLKRDLITESKESIVKMLRKRKAASLKKKRATN